MKSTNRATDGNPTMRPRSNRVTWCWFACKWDTAKQAHVIQLLRCSYTPLLRSYAF